MKYFARGQRSKLDALTPALDLQIGLDIVAPGQMVIDFGCFGVDAANYLVDERYFIFYNQPQAPDGSISMLGGQNGDREAFEVQLDKLPSFVRRLVFTATIDGTGTMAQITRGHVRVLSNGQEVVRYEFSGQDFHTEQALLVAEIYWKDGWRFWAVGQGFAGDLSTLLQHFGGEEAQDGAANPRTDPSVPVVAPPATTPPPPISPPVPLVSTTVPPPFLVSGAGSGGKLQQLIENAPPGATLTLMRDEYEGPLTIDKPLILEGQNSVIWARQGPVVTVTAAGVTLRDMEIEVTVPEEAQGEGDLALKAQGGTAPQLHNVGVRGRVSGVGDESGDWSLPGALDLGQFAPRQSNEYSVKIAVPTSCRLASSVAGLALHPAQLEAGVHEIMLTVRDMTNDTFIAGKIEVRAGEVVRSIPVTGRAMQVENVPPVRGKLLWSVDNPAC